jgi:hypothetical protein
MRPTLATKRDPARCQPFAPLTTIDWAASCVGAFESWNSVHLRRPACSLVRVDCSERRRMVSAASMTRTPAFSRPRVAETLIMEGSSCRRAGRRLGSAKVASLTDPIVFRVTPSLDCLPPSYRAADKGMRHRSGRFVLCHVKRCGAERQGLDAVPTEATIHGLIGAFLAEEECKVQDRRGSYAISPWWEMEETGLIGSAADVLVPTC